MFRFLATLILETEPEDGYSHEIIHHLSLFTEPMHDFLHMTC